MPSTRNRDFASLDQLSSMIQEFGNKCYAAFLTGGFEDAAR